MCLLPHLAMLLQGGVGIRLQLGKHARLHLCSFLRRTTRNRFGPHMSFLSSLLHISFERGEGNAKHLDNLSPGIIVVHGS